jgi:hypothetical protein
MKTVSGMGVGRSQPGLWDLRSTKADAEPRPKEVMPDREPGILYISARDRAAIRRLKGYARQNPVRLEEVERRDMCRRQGDPPPRNRAMTLTIPCGYEVTYEVDEREDGYYSHLAVAVDEAAGAALTVKVAMLAQEFGLHGRAVLSWVEPLPPPGRRLIHLEEPLEVIPSMRLVAAVERGLETEPSITDPDAELDPDA